METEAEKQLAKLVSMPTISDDIVANDLALDYLEHYLEVRGMFTRRNRYSGHGTLLASTRADNHLNPTVLLAAHVDVSPANKDMFRLKRVGDKLCGRGVFDMKFSIAGYLQLVDDLQGSIGSYDFAIMITSDEEVGGHGTSGLIEAGVRPKVCILPDSTAPGWNIETVAKGYWRFDLIAPGRAAHGAKPWEGESASFKLIQALHELKELFAGHHAETDTLNIGKIHGGQTYNVIPSEMVAMVEIRYLNKETLREKRAMVQQLCKKHGVTSREIIVCSAVLTDLTDPLIVEYLDSVQAVVGKRPAGHISCAASDAPYFFDVGINCIISCCDGGGHHGEGEWISRKSFRQFVPILHHYLEKTAKTAPAAGVTAEIAQLLPV